MALQGMLLRRVCTPGSALTQHSALAGGELVSHPPVREQPFPQVISEAAVVGPEANEEADVARPCKGAHKLAVWAVLEQVGGDDKVSVGVVAQVRPCSSCGSAPCLAAGFRASARTQHAT